jgi:hypothetical protein
VVSSYEHGNEPWTSVKGMEFFDWLASQEGLCSLEFVSHIMTYELRNALTDSIFSSPVRNVNGAILAATRLAHYNPPIKD